ncbi:hypothetical protein LLE87_28010, partial [Paenibacillus polymyxa]|nr:hypothetical protein [Paenibacillus polymyxa]
MHELLMQKAHVDAEQAARRIIKLAPNFWDAWEALAFSLFGTFRNLEALQAALTMLDLAPADAQSHIMLAAVLTQLGRTSEAIVISRRA